MGDTPQVVAAAPGLRRVLTLRDLILTASSSSSPPRRCRSSAWSARRRAATSSPTILIAMVAMLFTAISYGRMARAYPSAGSAYTYVGREIHPALGYLTGWSMVMDYMLNPLICTIWCTRPPATSCPRSPTPSGPCFFAALVHRAQPARHQGQRRAPTRSLAAGHGRGDRARSWAPRPLPARRRPLGPGDFLRPFYDPGDVLRGRSSRPAPRSPC